MTTCAALLDLYAGSTCSAATEMTDCGQPTLVDGACGASGFCNLACSSDFDCGRFGDCVSGLCELPL